MARRFKIRRQGGGSITVIIRDKELISRANKNLAQGMRGAVQLARDATVRKLNRGQPTRTTPSGRLIGLDPSKPGEPPKKVTTRLQGSIEWEVVREEGDWVGRWGTNVVYGRRQELGFFGRDAIGRNVRHFPRPYLRPVLNEEFDRMMAEIAKHKV